MTVVVTIASMPESIRSGDWGSSLRTLARSFSAPAGARSAPRPPRRLRLQLQGYPHSEVRARRAPLWAAQGYSQAPTFIAAPGVPAFSSAFVGRACDHCSRHPVQQQQQSGSVASNPSHRLPKAMEKVSVPTVVTNTASPLQRTRWPAAWSHLRCASSVYRGIRIQSCIEARAPPHIIARGPLAALTAPSLLRRCLWPDALALALIHKGLSPISLRPALAGGTGDKPRGRAHIFGFQCSSPKYFNQDLFRGGARRRRGNEPQIEPGTSI